MSALVNEMLLQRSQLMKQSFMKDRVPDRSLPCIQAAEMNYVVTVRVDGTSDSMDLLMAMSAADT